MAPVIVSVTKPLQIAKRHVLGSIKDKFFMKPMILLHLLILFSRCSLKFNLVARIKPSSLHLSNILTWDWLKERGLGLVLTILQEKQILTTCFLASGLKFIFHRKAYFLIIMRL